MNRKKYTDNQKKAYKQTSGYRLLKAMDIKGINNIDLAEKVDCSDQTISNFINNKNDILNSKYPLIEKICSELNIDIDYLQGKITHSNKELEIICNYTGLSEEAVMLLHESKDSPDKYNKKLSHLISCYSRDFRSFVINLFRVFRARIFTDNGIKASIELRYDDCITNLGNIREAAREDNILFEEYYNTDSMFRDIVDMYHVNKKGKSSKK